MVRPTKLARPFTVPDSMDMPEVCAWIEAAEAWLAKCGGPHDLDTWNGILTRSGGSRVRSIVIEDGAPFYLIIEE